MIRKKHLFRVSALLLAASVLLSGLISGCGNAADRPAGETTSSETLSTEKTVPAGTSTAGNTAAAETSSEGDAASAELSAAGSTSAAGTSSEGDTASADIPAGTYAPAFFTFSGGTGKVKITCPEVTVSEQPEATLVFSSPHYEWVKVDGIEYLPDNAEESGRESSVFTIPVLLEKEMKISALTTAMSEPHEIEYTILISLDESKSDPEKKDEETEEDTSGGESYVREAGADHAAPELPGLVFVFEKETSYAEAFVIRTYRAEAAGDASGAVGVGNLSSPAGESGQDPGAAKAEDFRLIDVYGNGGARYLLVPEGAEVPEELQKAMQGALKKTAQNGSAKAPGQAEDVSGGAGTGSGSTDDVDLGKITVLQAPLDNLYVAATSSMALFDAAGALGQVKLTGTDQKGWYIEAPKRALEEGSMVYAGKYSAPDYELLASSGCSLAVESMMILHTPEVKEKLEELGIPVFIDTSSSESHPMGRTEWVRLYGVLTGHEAEADAFFEEQKKIFTESETYTDTGKTAAFFSITSSGNVVVRAADDYIPRMIGLAGGQYVFKDLVKGTGNSASVRLSMEDFYNTAKDADYLIYNATIEQPVKSIRELCGKFALLSEFKAVREGHVWQVRGSLYQSPDIVAQMITDLRHMLTGENESEMVFLEPVD